MRIRTVKPEFWTSETIAPLSDSAKLLAIGLLNYADDEGYFWANPVLIRAAIFPFQDSSKMLLGLIQDLSRAGYIRLGLAEDGKREVGQVVNFKLHQRIDKPKPTIIGINCKFLDASKTHPRSIQDASQQEGKGKEGNGTGNDLLSGKPDGAHDVATDKSEKPGKYHKDARAVLHILNEAAGKHFREVDANLSVITARFNEGGVTLEGVRAMIGRQCARWGGTDMAEFLRPATLFSKTNFDGYYAAKDSPVIVKGQNGHVGASASDRVCADLERLIK